MLINNLLAVVKKEKDLSSFSLGTTESFFSFLYYTLYHERYDRKG